MNYLLMNESILNLHQVLSALPVSVLSYLNAGVPRSEAEACLNHLPFKLPAGVFELYEWRNGTDTNGFNGYLKELYLLRRGCFMPLSDSIEQYEHFRDNDFEYYSASFFPLVNSFGEEHLVIDCDPQSPTYHMILSYEIKHVYLSEGAVPIYDSLQSMLETVTACYLQGAYFYAPGSPVLQIDFEAEEAITEKMNPKAATLRVKTSWN
jgi:hypothetical protein